MNLNEAIKHCEEKAEELNQRAESAENNGQYKFSDECKECAAEHEQLAAWLEELKTLRKAYDLIAEDCTNTYLEEEKQDIKDYYLQKARESNDT